MTREDTTSLADLVQRVADGEDVDWGTAERSAPDPRTLGWMRNLRIVEDVARSSERILASVERTQPARGGGSAPAPVRWGTLEVGPRIGCGSYGEVLQAHDPDLQRDGALKLLYPHVCAQPRLAARILEEGRLLARISHPNVVRVFKAESHDGRVGLWMERVEGRSLAEIVSAEGPMAAGEAAAIGVALCRALAAVHGAGLVHRDVKAVNVLRERGGRIVLMDFGASREVRDLDGGERRVSGTPLYLAPEVYGGQPMAQPADLYALGVLLFHLVTGTYPVAGDTLEDLREAHARGERRLLRDVRSDLPPDFVRVVERALESHPDDRYATVGEMERALEQTLGGGAPDATTRTDPLARRERWRRVAAAAAVVVVLSIAGWAALRGPVGYEVDATLFRRDGRGAAVPVVPGQRLAVGDRLWLEIEASRDLWLYVVNRDDRGAAWRLFPRQDAEPSNPLAAGRGHRIPGGDPGEGAFDWRVTTAGGRERLLLVAGPERLVELERELARLPEPVLGGAPAPLSERAETILRGIGGLSPSAPPGEGRAAAADSVFDLARELSGADARTTGVWVRRIELVND